MTKSMSIGGCTYDLFIQTDNQYTQTRDNQEYFTFRTGDKIPITSVIEAGGGGASNTAIGLARLGLEASYCGVLASDEWGQYLLRNFATEGVNTDAVTIVDQEVSSFSLILSSQTGERTILYTPGSNTHLHDAIFPVENFKDTDWIYYNHIPEHSCVIHDDIIAMVQNAKRSITWNPGGCQLHMGYKEAGIHKLLQHTTILQLNKEEAMRFTNTNNKLEALQLLLATGCTIVCITDGMQGTIASDGTNIYSCDILQTKTVDTTGAGDAFGVGLTWAISQQLPLPIALKAGSINAASVVTYMGAQAGLLTHNDMRQKLEHTTLTVSTHSF